MSHKVSIRIDTSEVALRNWLKRLPPKQNLKFRKMPVGDILFIVDTKPVLLIERKEVGDFQKSVSEGRFREQRSRMIDLWNEHPQLTLAYLIEGDLNKLEFNPHGQGIQLSHLRDLINDLGGVYGIVHLTSINVTDTMRLIGRYENVYRKKGSVVDITSASSITKNMSIGKKRGMDPDQFGPCALSLIPGLTREAAMAVAVIHPTLFSLISAYEDQDNHRDCGDLLVGIQYGDGLKIGKTVSRRVYVYLMDIQPPPKKPAPSPPKRKAPPPKPIAKPSRGRSASPKRPAGHSPKRAILVD